MEVNSLQKQKETLALLKLLAMGNLEIEQGNFRDVNAVFGDLEELDDRLICLEGGGLAQPGAVSLGKTRCMST